MDFKIRSYPNRIAVSKKMTTITTSDARYSSPRAGHDTLFISASTEIKKSAKLGMLTTRKPIHEPRAITETGRMYFAIASDIAGDSHRAKNGSPTDASLIRHAIVAKIATMPSNVS